MDLNWIKLGCEYYKLTAQGPECIIRSDKIFNNKQTRKGHGKWKTFLSHADLVIDMNNVFKKGKTEEKHWTTLLALITEKT